MERNRRQSDNPYEQVFGESGKKKLTVNKKKPPTEPGSVKGWGGKQDSDSTSSNKLSVLD